MEIKIGSKENEIVKCNGCGKEILTKDGFTFKDKDELTIYLCDNCKTSTEQELAKETHNPNMVLAIALGVIGAVVSGIIWYYFTVWTGKQIGYVSIGVGFVIGWAVLIGSGKKRGMVLQVTSAILTFITLLCSEYLIIMHYVREYMSSNQTEFPDYDGSFIFISPFDSFVLSNMFSPIGVLIWLIGIYVAYSVPKERAIE